MKSIAILISLLIASNAAFCGALNLSITTNRDRVGSGQAVTWSVLLSNSSSSIETGVELRVTLPTGVTDTKGSYYSDISDDYFNPDPDPDYGDTYDDGEVVIYNVGTLAAGASRLYQVTTFPYESTADGSQFIMMAQADSDNAASFASSQKAITFLNSPSSLTLSGNSIRFLSGSTLALTASYGYNGSESLPQATLEIILPSGVSASAATSGWKLDGSVLSWDLGTLRKGDNGLRTCSLVYKGSDPSGTLTRVKAILKSQNSGKYASEWPGAIAADNGLRLGVTSTLKQVLPGKPVTWSILLSNPLSYAATGVQLRVTLPTRITDRNGSYYSDISDDYFNPDPDPNYGDTYDDGEVVVYNVGTLAAGASRLYQVTTFPYETTADCSQFIMMAQADSDNGMPPASACCSVVFGANIPILPDIAVEWPTGIDLKDNQTTSIKFGTRRLGIAKSQSFKIINTGRANLTNLSLSVSGKHDRDWTLSPLATKSLAPGSSTTVKATFKPNKDGPRSAIIKIKSNDPNESPFEIRVSGAGKK